MEHSSSALTTAFLAGDWSTAIGDEPMMAHGRFTQIAAELPENGAGWTACLVLANLSGMMLEPSRWDEPYSPLMRLSGRRTALPEDFTAGELEFLSDVLPSLPPTLVTAQVADVLFLRLDDKARRYEYAKEAVARWIDVGLAADPSRAEEQGWRRAIEIALRFRLDAQVEKLVAIAIASIRTGDTVGAWRIAQALRESGAGRQFADELSPRLLDAARSVSDNHVRREVLDEARRWFNVAGDEVASATVEQEIGDLWWEDAKASRARSHMIARDWYGNAYSQYRTVKRSLRSAKTAKRLGVLPRKIREAGVKSLEEMHSFRSDPIDLTPLRDLAEKVAAEPNTLDALAMWFTYLPLESFESARTTAEESIAENIITHLANRTTVDSDGRTVHRSATSRARGNVPADVWDEMVRHISQKSGLYAQGYIWPALVRFSSQRRLTFGDFSVFVRASPFVPPEQEWFFATALHNGYYGRLTEALHVLAPTMEACVRACLQRAGVETRNIRSDDTEIEPGLSALMELEGVDDALGADLSWHIRALYCGPLGPNLRNRVAHGLLTADESKGAPVLFAWWLAFRLAFIPYINLVRDAGDASANSDESPSADAQEHAGPGAQA